MIRVHQRRGSALVVTLWVLAALIILAAGLGLTARTEIRIARNYTERIKCRWAARAAIEAALLRLKEADDLSLSVLTGGENGVVLTSEELELNMGEAGFTIVIEDESGRVNVNTASAEMLENIFGDSEAADSIIDWRDADDISRASGAETEYYSTLERPYRARNASLLAVGELHLIKGIPERLSSSTNNTTGLVPIEIFTVYSRDRNINAAGQKRVNILAAERNTLTALLSDILDDSKINALMQFISAGNLREVADIVGVAELSREDIKGIYDRLTLSNAEEIEGLININTVSAAVLAAVPGLDEGMAERIIAYRTENGPFNDVGALLDISDIPLAVFREIAPLFTARSSIYRLTASGFIRDGRPFIITCVVDMDGGTPRILYWQE